MWVDIKDGRDSLVFGIIYRPPNLDRTNSKIIWEEISKASRYNKVCIVGDFNFRYINWRQLTGNLESDDFLEVVQDNFLHQFVTEPTRGDNILDLVLSNRENLINNVNIGDKLGSSDHNEIRFNINWRNKPIENLTVVPNFRQANYDGLRTFLQEAWGYLDLSSDLTHGDVRSGYETENPTVEEGYLNFKQIIHRGQEQNIPNKQFRTGNSDPRWLNNRLKYLIGKKKGIYRRVQRGEERLRNKYLDLNRQVKREIRKAKRGYEVKVASESKVNPKVFFSDVPDKG